MNVIYIAYVVLWLVFLACSRLAHGGVVFLNMLFILIGPLLVVASFVLLPFSVRQLAHARKKKNRMQIAVCVFISILAGAVVLYACIRLFPTFVDMELRAFGRRL